jgi:hypothetical protein
MQIQGFADVDFHATNEKGQTNSFLLGQLDLFITSRLSEKFSVLSELILEAGQDNAFTFEVHRLLLKYSMNDYFNLSAGRYHSSIGYYNTAFHHGSFFKLPSIARFFSLSKAEAVCSRSTTSGYQLRAVFRMLHLVALCR